MSIEETPREMCERAINALVDEPFPSTELLRWAKEMEAAMRDKDEELDFLRSVKESRGRELDEKDAENQMLQRACASAEAWIADSGTTSDGAMDILRELRAARVGSEEDMSSQDVLREMRSVQFPGLDVTMNAWATAIEAAMREKDEAHRAAMRTCMEWRRKEKVEMERLESVVTDTDAAMYEANAEMERLREICDDLYSDKERLREALERMTTDCMESDFNEHWDTFKNAEAVLAEKEDKT